MVFFLMSLRSPFSGKADVKAEARQRSVRGFSITLHCKMFSGRNRDILVFFPMPTMKLRLPYSRLSV